MSGALKRLDAAQHQVLDRIEADHTAIDGIVYAGSDVIDPEHLHQPQNLHELALALLANLRLERSPKWSTSSAPRKV
jgi:hypothetical protein